MIGELEGLVARRGGEPLSQNLLILPNDEFFPDGWGVDTQSLGSALYRLLEYAGFQTPKVRLFDYCAAHEETGVDQGEVFYTGVADDGALEFEVHQLGPMKSMLGIASHEAAKAWLDSKQISEQAHPFRGQALSQYEVDDALSSIAAVYLGFGVLATNASHTIRHGGDIRGQYVYTTEWSVSQAGGLSPTAMAFLLATQLACRGESKGVLGHLRPNQKRDTKRWLDAILADDLVALQNRLQAGSASTSRACSLSSILPGHVEVVVAVSDGGVTQYNCGQPVFRVPRHYGWYGFVVGLALGFVGIVATVPLRRFWIVPPLALILPIVVGSLWGYRRRAFICSDGACERQIPDGASQCEGCGGTVSGDIASRKERLEAEERLLDNPTVDNFD